ncbi:MAG: hypothetical protein LBC92_03935 [Rickettsiales bacterium]|jgi:hypothetical protein|nr:hypothetical protein [Rickettsiales bacterium]
MNISFSNANKISDLKTKVLVKVVSEDFVSNNRGNGADIDSDPLQYAIQNNGFSGKMCEFTTVTLPSVRVIFCGTGNKDESNKYENIGHKIYKYLRQQEIKDVSILFNANVGDTIIYEEQNNLINIINGFLLSSYDFVK